MCNIILKQPCKKFLALSWLVFGPVWSSPKTQWPDPDYGQEDEYEFVKI